MRVGSTQQSLSMQVFFTLVETTAKLVEVSEKYWQPIGQNGARVRISILPLIPSNGG